MKLLLPIPYAAAFISLSSGTIFGQFLAYEGFATSAAPGTDVTTVGATGFGFESPTTDNTNFRMDIEAGLSYTDSFGNNLLVTGGSVGMEAITSGTQNFQMGLSNPISNTGTVFMSFLVNVTDVTTWGIMTGLTSGQVGDAASPTAALRAAFRSTSSNYGIYSEVPKMDQRTGPPTGAGTYFVVSKLDMTAETMTTYLNPTNLQDVENTSTTLFGTLDSSWSTLDSFIFSLGGDEAGTIDEIRIGTTLADVTPVPEPSTVGLVFGCAALLLLATRKKKS
jgi:hypothetical protein